MSIAFSIARRNVRDLAIVFSVAGKRFDYCVDFTRNDRSAFLALLSAARKRIASYRVREQSKTRARVYTDFVSVRVRDMHTIDYNLALLEPLGVRDCFFRSEALICHKRPTKKPTRLRREWKITKPYVILHPGSARREKLWEPRDGRRSLTTSVEDDELDLVLTSGPSARRASAHQQQSRQLRRQKFIDLSGKTDLLTLAALIGQARLLVTVDSAPDASRGCDAYAAGDPVRANQSVSLAAHEKVRH